jgi:hypothetical protein
MKIHGNPVKTGRFDAPVRYYHRAGAKSRVGWDEWVGESPAARKTPIRKRALLLLFLLLGLAVGVILALGPSAG